MAAPAGAAVTMRAGAWRFATQPFTALIALMAILACVGWYATPASEQSSVGQVIAHPWDYVWSTSYGIAGALVLLGIGRGRASWESAGVLWMAGAIAINVVTLVVLRGWAVVPLLPTFIAAFGACCARAAVLLRGWDVILVRRGEGMRHDR